MNKSTKFGKEQPKRGDVISIEVPVSYAKNGSVPEGHEEEAIAIVNKTLSSVKDSRTKSFDFVEWLARGERGLKSACEIVTGKAKSLTSAALEHIPVLLVLLNNKVVTKTDLDEFRLEGSMPILQQKVALGLIAKVFVPALKSESSEIPALGYLPVNGGKSGAFNLPTAVFTVREFMKVSPLPSETVKDFARAILLWSKERYSAIKEFGEHKDRDGNAITAADISRILSAITVKIEKMDVSTATQAIVACMGLTYGVRPKLWANLQ